MSGLVLKLSPKERVLINGAVIENGDRRSRLSIVTPNANILRLRDAIHPQDANTPVRRLCYVAQLVLSGDADPEDGHKQLQRGVEQMRQVFIDPESRAYLDQASENISDEKYYQALKALRALLPIEDALFKRAAE
ncbi:flagellar biosynthesis repressor FlbT [Poseidonocella sedimentorum]|uniref:Flagellar protein FlbT n=1 Tax=Poseidonocella sedimentorum TaxID=871652 RepID=A0A1I6D5P3_9RHOB|nr:flagellar biosynthesis repressor FlbT [Poseidonocella sedimentorum]SFR00637.1 flagellar protein FlbT [Poseidonocella sedimentorum]